MGGFSSVSHWVIVLIIVILLFGAKKIPELAKGIGSGIKNFKEAMNDEDKAKTEEKKEEIPSQTTASTSSQTTTPKV